MRALPREAEPGSRAHQNAAKKSWVRVSGREVPHRGFACQARREGVSPRSWGASRLSPGGQILPGNNQQFPNAGQRGSRSALTRARDAGEGAGSTELPPRKFSPPGGGAVGVYSLGTRLSARERAQWRRALAREGGTGSRGDSEIIQGSRAGHPGPHLATPPRLRRGSWPRRGVAAPAGRGGWGVRRRAFP